MPVSDAQDTLGVITSTGIIAAADAGGAFHSGSESAHSGEGDSGGCDSGGGDSGGGGGGW